MKTERRELLVSVINEKITSLKSDVLEKERAIEELEDARAELAGGKSEQPASVSLKEKTTRTKTTKTPKPLKITKTKMKGSDMKGQPAPFKSCYKHVFWNKVQGKWNGQVPNPDGGPPEKLTKSSDKIEECADFVVEKLGLESVEDIFIEV